MTEGKEQKTEVDLTMSETKERNLLLEKLEKSGEFDRLKKSAYALLMLHGWKEEIQKGTRQAIQRSNGGTDSIEEITLDELSETIVKHDVHSVPLSIKNEFSLKIRQACGYNDQQQLQR
mmetsp:Transcript_41379/g.46206  ORF Transcript_41379/g.46206 Transcript_41379/m.46206 type:complete len:119 (+) Transcript_41379:37-393(+)